MSNKHEKKFKAFVLMPFDKEFDAIFNNLIRPPLEEIGYDVKRADSDLNQENILKDVMRGIAGADLVVVDLTSTNANVLYELGISHTMQRSTVLLTQSIEDVPFDLRSYRMIRYSIHFNEAPKLSKELKEIGEGAKTGKIRFSNPVADFLPQMREPKIYIPKKPTARKGKKPSIITTEAEIKEREEKGFLDFAVNGEKSMKNIKKSMERMTGATQEIGEIMQKRTKEANETQRSRVPGTASRMHKIAKAIAVDMIQYAKKLEEEQPKLHNGWKLFNENTEGFIKTAHVRSKEDKEAVIKFRNIIDKLKAANRDTLDKIQKYREAITGLRGISREVNRASNRVASVLDLIISDYAVADSYCTKVITLLDEKIKQKENI